VVVAVVILLVVVAVVVVLILLILLVVGVVVVLVVLVVGVVVVLVVLVVAVVFILLFTKGSSLPSSPEISSSECSLLPTGIERVSVGFEEEARGLLRSTELVLNNEYLLKEDSLLFVGVGFSVGGTKVSKTISEEVVVVDDTSEVGSVVVVESN